MTHPGSSDSTADPAAAALARVRSASRAVRDTTRRSEPELSSARPDGRDPQALAAAMDSWVRSEGHTASLAVGGLIGRWEEIVGERIAAHVSVSEYRPDPGGGGTAVLSADSQEWAVQIRYLMTELQRRITEEI